MSITDELRKWANTEVPYKYGNQLTSIADRIDAEHEKAVTAAHSNGITEYGSMVAREYVKLPVDVDGEPWRLGDELLMEGEVCEVVGIGGHTIFYAFGDGVEWTIAHNNRHYHAPTVEDVLREFAEKVTDSQIPGVHPTYEEAIAEYAQRLQLREVDE